jgi:hypothetical protein
MANAQAIKASKLKDKPSDASRRLLFRVISLAIAHGNPGGSICWFCGEML